MNKNTYYKEIDILKGIGIFLVVLGHLTLPEALTKFVFSFHMPLFFFVSGFVFKSKGNLTFIKDKFKRILVPYFVFSTITYLLYYVSNYTNVKITIKDYLIGTLLGISNDYYLSWNVVLWFLPSLFFINILFNFLCNYFKYKASIIIVVLFLISFYFLRDNTILFLPFHIGSALLMIPFFIFGFLLKQQYSMVVNLFKNKGINLILSSFLMFLIGTILSYINYRIPDVRIHIVGNPFFFYFGALFTVLGLLGIAHFIHSKILVWLGVNSLIIMCIHLKIRATVTLIVGTYLPFDDYLGFSQALLIIIVCVPFVYIINRWFPIIIGLKND